MVVSNVSNKVFSQQAHFRALFDKELAEHAELRNLEEPAQGSQSAFSTKDGSVAPSTTTNNETPQPTPGLPPTTGGTRIKLTVTSSASSAAASLNNSNANGQSNGAPAPVTAAAAGVASSVGSASLANGGGSSSGVQSDDD